MLRSSVMFMSAKKHLVCLKAPTLLSHERVPWDFTDERGLVKGAPSDHLLHTKAVLKRGGVCLSKGYGNPTSVDLWCSIQFESVLFIYQQITTNVTSGHFKHTIQFKSNSSDSKLIQFIAKLNEFTRFG